MQCEDIIHSSCLNTLFQIGDKLFVNQANNKGYCDMEKKAKAATQKIVETATKAYAAHKEKKSKAAEAHANEETNKAKVQAENANKAQTTKAKESSDKATHKAETDGKEADKKAYESKESEGKKELRARNFSPSQFYLPPLIRRFGGAGIAPMRGGR